MPTPPFRIVGTLTTLKTDTLQTHLTTEFIPELRTFFTTRQLDVPSLYHVSSLMARYQAEHLTLYIDLPNDMQVILDIRDRCRHVRGAVERHGVGVEELGDINALIPNKFEEALLQMRQFLFDAKLLEPKEAQDEITGQDAPRVSNVRVHREWKGEQLSVEDNNFAHLVMAYLEGRARGRLVAEALLEVMYIRRGESRLCWEIDMGGDTEAMVEIKRDGAYRELSLSCLYDTQYPAVKLRGTLEELAPQLEGAVAEFLSIYTSLKH